MCDARGARTSPRARMRATFENDDDGLSLETNMGIPLLLFFLLFLGASSPVASRYRGDIVSALRHYRNSEG